MSIFGAKKKSFLGVDLGAGGMKVAELQNEKGRARLVTYGFTERPPGAEPLNMVDTQKETAELLKKIVQKAKATTMRCIAGLPIASVFSAVISVPKTGEKDFKEAVLVQAKKLIPVPLEEMVIDYKEIAGVKSGMMQKAQLKDQPKDQKDQKKKDEPKTVQVLLTGAARAMVQKYVNVFKLAGLELDSLETETFALIRALIGKDRATTMIVDMGAVRTNIIIVENGIPYVTRSLDMGGTSLTRAIAKALGIEDKAAEEMKTDIKSVSSLYPGEGLPKVFEATVAPMLTELQYSLNLYAGQDSDVTGKSVEKIILTGGSSAIPQLAGHFSAQLNIKTYLGDPWARVVYPDALRPTLDEIGPRFAVGVGLAMRDIE